MGRKNKQRENLTPLPLANKVQPGPRRSGGVCESDQMKGKGKGKDKSKNRNLEPEFGIPNTGSLHELVGTPDSTRSFCISIGTPDEVRMDELQWDNYHLGSTNVNQDLKLGQKNQKEISTTFSQINESTGLNIVQETSAPLESKKGATINVQLDGQNNNKILVVPDEWVKDYKENSNSPLGSNKTPLSEDKSDTSSSIQETTFARENHNATITLSKEDLNLSISNNFDINNFNSLHQNKKSGNNSDTEFIDSDGSGQKKVNNGAEIFLVSKENASSPILSKESFVTAENESETYKSSDDSILTDSDSIYTHDDQQDFSLRNEQSSRKEVSKDTLVKLDEENKSIEITNTDNLEASKHNEDDSNQLLNSSEPPISASSTPGNSPKEVSRESIDSKSSRILQKICFSAIDTSEGKELVYKTSSYNQSQKNSKGKKVSLCLTALSCAVFFGSLTSSFLGKPLISDQKGNLILLAILGAAFVILGSITLVLYCCPQAKENKPLDTLDQVSIDDAKIKILSS
ncbi:hypothetical protein [Wolbachia endosymbiont (group A) of Bombylius major]|uniref:hypothetical protein n=1 Tax=Wolbachia endosymbiont (group A) of Bombylius major TaxID=2953988 RepID=UPI002231489B|nr:hypothetical protein [Wolbachia endosymbiont (group A) of Bombylius major]